MNLLKIIARPEEPNWWPGSVTRFGLAVGATILGLDLLASRNSDYGPFTLILTASDIALTMGMCAALTNRARALGNPAFWETLAVTDLPADRVIRRTVRPIVLGWMVPFLAFMCLGMVLNTFAWTAPKYGPLMVTPWGDILQYSRLRERSECLENHVISVSIAAAYLWLLSAILRSLAPPSIRHVDCTARLSHLQARLMGIGIMSTLIIVLMIQALRCAVRYLPGDGDGWLYSAIVIPLTLLAAAARRAWMAWNLALATYFEARWNHPPMTGREKRARSSRMNSSSGMGVASPLSNYSNLRRASAGHARSP